LVANLHVKVSTDSGLKDFAAQKARYGLIPDADLAGQFSMETLTDPNFGSSQMINICLDSPIKVHQALITFLWVSGRTAASLVGNFALTDRLDAAALTAEADLRSRAEDRGGSLTLDEGDEKGFRLPWAIPIG
jgi:hypothetical protein